jgi:hypothetical protein
MLLEVCRGAQALAQPGFVSKTYLSFYAVLLCEVLVGSPQVTEALLTCLLPFLVAGLKEGAARDYRAATLMVLTQLLARAQLSKDFLAGEGGMQVDPWVVLCSNEQRAWRGRRCVLR